LPGLPFEASAAACWWPGSVKPVPVFSAHRKRHSRCLRSFLYTSDTCDFACPDQVCCAKFRPISKPDRSNGQTLTFIYTSLPDRSGRRF